MARWLVAALVAAITLFFGALLFERPAEERVAEAFRKAEPGMDLVIVDAGTRTWRTARRGTRFNRREVSEPATALWCAHDRRDPERRMALEYQNVKIPLMSGARTLSRSWVPGRGVTADAILAECASRAASGPPALP